MAREPGRRGGRPPVPETETRKEEAEPAFSEAGLRYLKMRGRKPG